METDAVRSIRVGFFRKGATGDYVAFDTAITKIYGFDNEAVIYPKTGDAEGLKRKVFELPLDIYNDGTGFIFEKGDKKDTLIFLHKQRYEVYTPDCGYSVRIYDLSVFKSTFPNYKIISTSPSSANTYDFEIRP
jgi:hypothetical protein